MSRQHDQNGRDSSWRELAWAGGGAAVVTLLLVATVGLVWLVGRSPSEAPALGAPSAPTPTPRSLAFLRETPTAGSPTAVAQATSPISVEQTAPDPTGTPSLLSMPSDDPDPSIENEALFSAASVAELTTLASGSWSISPDGLRNEGSNAVAEPWLKLATVPGADFAVEAEIRVDGLLDSVCDQSFGLIGGDAESGRVYGGGLLFPCDSDGARARLTEVSLWQDGYNADPIIAENAFDPGDDWRTYRFEVRGDQIRLIVDGVGIVAGTRPTPADANAKAEAGLWAQGVALEVRSVAVYPLPSR